MARWSRELAYPRCNGGVTRYQPIGLRRAHRTSADRCDLAKWWVENPGIYRTDIAWGPRLTMGSVDGSEAAVVIFEGGPAGAVREVGTADPSARSRRTAGQESVGASGDGRADSQRHQTEARPATWRPRPLEPGAGNLFYHRRDEPVTSPLATRTPATSPKVASSSLRRTAVRSLGHLPRIVAERSCGELLRFIGLAGREDYGLPTPRYVSPMASAS